MTDQTKPWRLDSVTALASDEHLTGDVQFSEDL